MIKKKSFSYFLRFRVQSLKFNPLDTQILFLYISACLTFLAEIHLQIIIIWFRLLELSGQCLFRQSRVFEEKCFEFSPRVQQIIMNKPELYRVCLKSSIFQDIPTFRIKIGKTQKKIHPYFIPSDKQRYNCDSILERNNQESELILSVFYAYKFIGSGSIKFDKPDMPNERVEIINRDKESIAFIDCSLIKINKVVQVPALDIVIKTLVLDDIGPKNMSSPPFLVLKYGQLNYQTEKKPVFNTDNQFVFNEHFKFPESEMERVIVEAWCEIEGNNTFLGVCLIYLREKEDINKQLIAELSYMSKKRGKAVISISEDKQKEAKLKDYSHAPKRTIKTTVIQAVTLDPSRQGTYVKLQVDKQEFETTQLFVQKRQLRWNQAFTMQVNSQKEELQARLCVKQQGKQEQLGRAFLQISKVANRTYELTLLDDKQKDIGKVYLQFYDHELIIKQRKTIPKQLAAKITADIQAIKNRYKSKQPLHQYMQGLHAVLEQGLILVSKKKPENPLRQLGEFLLAYRKE